MDGKQLKNSILQWAIQGKLVPQNPKDEPAQKLLERIAASRNGDEPCHPERSAKGTKSKDLKKKKSAPSSRIYRENGVWYEQIGSAAPKDVSDEIPFEIPENWVWSRLKNIVYNHGQKTPIEPFSYIDIGSIDNKHQKLNDKENIIQASAAPSRARKIVELNDILYSTVRPYLHNMCVIDRDFSKEPIASTGFAVMACYECMIVKFLFYYLMSPEFDDYANDGDNAKGIAYPAINDEKLYKALIPIPPLAEQKRIVAKLEQVLPLAEEYGAAQEQLDKLNKELPEALKKSILQQAIQGKLVPQNPKDEPASKLLERITLSRHSERSEESSKGSKKTSLRGAKATKQSKDSFSRIYRENGVWYEQIGSVAPKDITDGIPFEIPETWVWCRLDSLGTFVRGNGIKRDEITSKGKPCVRYGEMYTTYKVKFSEVKSFTTPIVFNKCQKFHKNDILMALTGENKWDIALAAVYEGDEEVALGGDLCRFTPFECNSLYLVYLINSPYGIGYKRETSTGDIIVHTSTSKLGNFLVPLPPLAEQKRIVAKLEQLFKVL